MISQIAFSNDALWVMQSPGFEKTEECAKLKKVIPQGSVGFTVANDESNIVIRAPCYINALETLAYIPTMQYQQPLSDITGGNLSN